MEDLSQHYTGFFPFSNSHCFDWLRHTGASEKEILHTLKAKNAFECYIGQSTRQHCIILLGNCENNIIITWKNLICSFCSTVTTENKTSEFLIIFVDEVAHDNQ